MAPIVLYADWNGTKGVIVLYSEQEITAALGIVPKYARMSAAPFVMVDYSHG